MKRSTVAYIRAHVTSHASDDTCCLLAPDIVLSLCDAVESAWRGEQPEDDEP